MHVKTLGTALRKVVSGFGLRGKLVRRIGGTGLIIFVAIGVLNYNQVSSNLQQQAEQTGRAQACRGREAARRRTANHRRARAKGWVQWRPMPGVDQPQLRVYLRDILPQVPAAQAYDDYMFWDNQSYRRGTPRPSTCAAAGRRSTTSPTTFTPQRRPGTRCPSSRAHRVHGTVLRHGRHQPKHVQRHHAGYARRHVHRRDRQRCQAGALRPDHRRPALQHSRQAGDGQFRVAGHRAGQSCLLPRCQGPDKRYVERADCAYGCGRALGRRVPAADGSISP